MFKIALNIDPHNMFLLKNISVLILRLIFPQAAIWHCLNHYDYADATFLSERLYAEGNIFNCQFYFTFIHMRL